MSNAVSKLTVCFGVHCSLGPGLDQAECKARYENVFKPLVSALYTLPSLPFTISMCGPFTEWIERYHPEFLIILNEMMARKQIDIIGGGYYSPLFPLIPPSDRVGQIEMLTTVFRKVFGKRPRGAWLSASSWDPSMVASLNTCGIEYVLMDRIMLEMSGFDDVTGYEPVTIEDNGKTVTAIPLDNQYRNPERLTPDSFLAELLASVETGRDETLAVFIDDTSIPALFASGNGTPSWFEALVSLASETQGIELANAGKLLKSRAPFRRAYVQSGMSPFEFGEAGINDDLRILSRTSIKKYLAHSADIMNLYAKTMYVHSLVNQLRGDKARKNSAREDLWKAEYGDLYLPTSRADRQRFRKLRLLAYKNLLLAEKTSRIRGVFAPSIISLDFDLDGLKEHLCQLDKLNIYVHPEGGRVFELDLLTSNSNCCDAGANAAGLFVDHFVSAEEADFLSKTGSFDEPPVFAESLYQEVAVDGARQEIQLRCSGTFGSFQQPLTIRKQYNFRNEGIQVQYILKNESPLNLSGVFMVELDHAVTGLKNKAPGITVFSHDARQDSPVESLSYEDVEWVQISDQDNGAKFTFEPNENASILAFPVTEDGIVAIRLFLYWKVDLGPNYETEKTIFLKIDGQ